MFCAVYKSINEWKSCLIHLLSLPTYHPERLVVVTGTKAALLRYCSPLLTVSSLHISFPYKMQQTSDWHGDVGRNWRVTDSSRLD